MRIAGGVRLLQQRVRAGGIWRRNAQVVQRRLWSDANGCILEQRANVLGTCRIVE
jgi:hypothetical protein